MKSHLSLMNPKRFLALLLLSAGALIPAARAVPITISYDFKFDQNTSHPAETPLTGSLTLTVNTPASPSFTGYTTDAVVDALDFTIPGLPGFVAASTNYVKTLYISGALAYVIVSDRSDLALQTAGPRKEGYILGLAAYSGNLLTGTGITVGSPGSYFDYLTGNRGGIDIAYTFTQSNIVKVANPAPQTPSVPDSAATVGLVALALAGLAASRRFLA